MGASPWAFGPKSAELAGADTLGEGGPFVVAEEQRLLVGVGAVTHRHALGGAGQRDTGLDDAARVGVGRDLELLVGDTELQSCELHFGTPSFCAVGAFSRNSMSREYEDF